MAESNRRQFSRLGLRLHVSYTIAGSSKIGTGLSINVSGTGIRFVAEHLLMVGMRLKLQVTLPDRTQPIACNGEVVWSRAVSGSSTGQATEVGVHFVSILEQDRKLLTQYAMFYPPETEQDADRR